MVIRILLVLCVLTTAPIRAGAPAPWPPGGPAPEEAVADPVALGAARRALAGDSGAPLEDDAAQALLTATVAHVRTTLHSCGREQVVPTITFLEFFSAETIAGFCELAEAAGTFVLEDYGLPRTRVLRGQSEHCFGANAARHAFLMVDAGAGRWWLLDPTFRQFFHPTEDRRARQIGFSGRILLEQEGGRELAEELLRRGFAPLTSARAVIYARALARDRGFTSGLAAMTAGHEGPLEMTRMVFGSMLDFPGRRSP